MASKESHDNPRRNMEVLLVIIGGLGDWCLRRVLLHAKEFEATRGGNVSVAVIDVHPIRPKWRDAFGHWLTIIDQWIVRRLLEQTAEDVDQPLGDTRGAALKDQDWGFTGRLARDPQLPDPTAAGGPTPDTAITTFVERLGPIFQAAYQNNQESVRTAVENRMTPYLDEIESELSNNPAATITALAARWRFRRTVTTFIEVKAEIVQLVSDQVIRLAQKARKRLQEERTTLRTWLSGRISVCGQEVHRYWRFDISKNKLFLCPYDGGKVEAIDNARLSRLAQKYRVIVYAATPPDAYPDILKQWSSYAERIAFEKPIAGLLQRVD